MFEIASFVAVLAALVSFANHKFVRLPPAIGVMLLSMIASGVLIALGEWGGGFREHLS
jgi:monovalent cation:H+ antiporter, CPA1 family